MPGWFLVCHTVEHDGDAKKGRIACQNEESLHHTPWGSPHEGILALEGEHVVMYLENVNTRVSVFHGTRGRTKTTAGDTG